MNSRHYTLDELAAMLDLPPAYVEVYIALFVLGSLKEEEISSWLGLTRVECKEALGTLRKRKLVVKGLASYRPAPRRERESPTEAEEESLEYIAAFRRDAEDEDVGVLRYEGYEGIQQVYLEVLDEAIATGDPILGFESGMDAESVGDAFMKQYIQQRLAANVEAFVLSPNEAPDRAYREAHEGELTHVQLVDHLAIDANINVVGNLVMTYTLTPPRGTIRRDRSEAETLKSVFWKLWKHEQRGDARGASR